MQNFKKGCGTLSEFKLRLQTELDDSQAESQLKKLQEVANKKKIKLNIEIGDLANFDVQFKKIQTSLNKSFKLDKSSLSSLKQIRDTLKEIDSITNNNKGRNKNSLVSEYKQLAAESSAIQKQMSKTIDTSSYKALEKQLDSVENKMKNLKSVMSQDQLSGLKSFDDKIARNLERSYVSSFNKIQSEVTKLDSKLSSLGKSGYTDKNKLSSIVDDLNKIKNLDFNNISSGGLQNLTNDLEQIRNKIKEVEDDASRLKFNDKLNLDTSKVQNDLNKLRQACENVGSSTSDIDRLEQELRQLSDLPMDQVPNSLAKIKAEVNEMKSAFGGLNTTTKESNKFFSELYHSFSTFGLANILADGLQSSIRGIKDTVIDLDNSFRDLMKVAPDTFKGTSEELKQLKNDAISAGIEVARSSNDIIDGTSKAFQLGIKNVKDALEYSKQAAQFSNVSDLDQETANSYLASITAAYGGAANALKPLQGELKKTGEAYNTLTKFSDLANYAGNNFALTSADVGEALSRSASILNTYDTSMEDAIAMIVGMQEVNQNAQKTGTSIKTIATNLAAVKASADDGTLAANKTNKAFKELAGIDIWDKKNGEVKSTINVLSELSEKWEGLNDAQRTGIAEAAAGKEHINSFVGLLNNWKQVIKYQQDYKAGLMEGSSAKENERFVDSIEGRLVRLGEEFKKLTTTLVTTDMFKSLVTGAADFLSILNNIVSAFDKVGMGTPLLMGTFSSLFSLIKSKGTGDDMPNYFGSLINGYKSLNKESSISSIKLSKSNSAISKSFAATGKTMSTLSGQTVKYTTTSKNLAKIQSGQVPTLVNTAKGYNTLTVATKNTVKSTISATAKNALMSTGLTLLNGAFVSLAVAGVGVAVKAFDNYINRVEIAREKNKERIGELNSEISTYKTQQSGLKSIQKEYDELSNKTNRTKEESARLLELNKELAELMPELVSGYDEAGNPIINMRGDVADLITDLDQAIERKEKLLASEKREQAELAIEKLNKRELGGINKGANEHYDNSQEKLDAIYTDYNDKLRKIQEDRDKILDKMSKSETDKREKYQEKLRKNLQEELDLQNEYIGKYDEKYNEIQSLAHEVADGVFSGVKTSRTFTDDFSDDVKNKLLGLQNSLDFSGLKTSDDVDKAKRALLELGTAASTGKVDLDELQKTVDTTNQKFENGQLSYTEYTQTMNELSESIGKVTNTDPSFWNDMFRGLSKGSLSATQDLDAFLKTFNKTRKDLINGDTIAATLERQFKAVGNAFDELSNLPANVDIEAIVDIANASDLPEQISGMLKGLVNDGDFSMEDQKIALDVMLAYQQGDTQSTRKIIDEINEDLKSQGLPEIDAEVLFNAKLDTAEIEAQLEKYTNINERQEVKTLFTAEVVGLEKAELYEEVIKRLPADSTNTNTFLAECSGDLEELNTYEEVSKWLMANPEILTKYNIDLQGSEGIVEVHEGLSKLPLEKTTVVNIEKALAEGNIDSVVNAIQSLPPEKQLQIIAIIEQAMGNISTVDKKQLKDKITNLKANATDALSKIQNVDNKKVKDKNTTVNAKDNASSVIDAVNDKKVKNKSFTITGVFKTIGNAVSNFFGGKSVSTNQGKTISYEYSTPTVAEQSNKIALLSDNGNSNLTETQTDSSYNSFNPLSRATIKTPIANKGYNIDDSIKYNIEMLTELENRIKMVTNSLSALDTKMEQAVGSEKIKYLQEQNKLYEEQKKIQKELEDTLNKQRNYYKYVLEYKGFKFNSDGNLTNYEEKLASMEKYVESLEKSAKSAQDALSKVDSNSKNKTSLEKKANEAQSKYEREKDKLDEAKKYLQAYIDVQMTELPKCKEEWDKLNNSIIENNNEIKKIQHEKWTLNIESQWTVLNQELDKTNNQLEMINVLMENAFGNDKSKLIAEKISLLKKQKSELASNLSYLKSVQSELNKKLTGYGFKFDSNGNISNYVDQLNKLKETSTEFDDAKKLVDAYLDLFLDKVPDVEKEIAGLENTIKDSYKEQLEITKDIESKITEVYKKQVEERKKLIDEELDKRLDALEKEKKAYNDARKEADYNKDYNKQMETIADLEKQIDILSRDNSLNGQKKLQELMKQLADEQEKLQEMVQDKMDEQVNDMFDKESDRLEQEADKAKENLDDKYSDEKLQQIVKDTLSSGVFVGVNGEIQDLQSTLIDFENKFGDGMSAMGDIIKNELVTNLNIAKNTIQDMSNIIKELDLKQLHSKLDMSVLSSRSIYSDFKISSAKTPPIINFNKELIRVEGNITEDVLPQVEEMLNAAKNEIVREIVNSMD